jgi:8-oxo-dGTP pyrophosphatase MutT (NUDIX family)
LSGKSGMEIQDFEKEPKVVSWKKSLSLGGCTLRSIFPLKLLYKKNSELLFALVSADVIDPNGHNLPQYLFIRGHACIIVIQLHNTDTGEKSFLMIHQRRIGNGLPNLEFPAGMIDRNVNDPASVALKEVFEETGLSLAATDIHPLCDKPLFSSPGASDEGIYYFGACIDVSDKESGSLDGRNINNADENEHIRVILCSREKAEKETTSLQARLGLYLFDDFFNKKINS